MTGKLIALLISLTGIIHVIRKRRKAKHRYAPVRYKDSAQTSHENWRWREPPPELGFRIDHTPHASVLQLPRVKRRFFHLLLQALGYITLLFIAVAAIYVFFTYPERRVGLLAVIPMAILGWALLQVGRHPVRIELTPQRVILVLQYGLFLYRRIDIQKRPKIKIKGALQSTLTMDRSQEEPDFKLTLKLPTGLLFARRVHVMLRCNQSQGTWLTDGLQQWADA